MQYAPVTRDAAAMPALDGTPANTPAPSLTGALQATMHSPYKRQRVVIPAEIKKAPMEHSTWSPGPRLRLSIILLVLLLLSGTALVSFAPLGSGQESFTLFTRVSSWVLAQQSNWSVQAHLVQTTVATPNPTTGSYAPVAITLPKSQYVAMAEQDASSAGIPSQYFVRQIFLESGFNPTAHSPSGAEGIAQFMPATAAGLGINPWDPVAALRAAANLMASYAKSFGGNYEKALAAYNSGSANVNAAVASCGANWLGCLPAETQHYIATIMGT